MLKPNFLLSYNQQFPCLPHSVCHDTHETSKSAPNIRGPGIAPMILNTVDCKARERAR